MVIKLKKGQTGQQYASEADKRKVEEAKRKREEKLKDPEFVRKETKEREVAEKKTEPRPVRESEPIKAEKEKTGIAKLREEDTIIGKAVRVATDWRTTVFLVGTLASLGVGWAVAGASATAKTGAVVATRQSFLKGGSSIITRSVGGKTTEKFIVGKVASKTLGKVGKGYQYATNVKSMALTTKLFIGAGLTMGAVALARDILGTYPFAGFIKEEALQTTGLPMKAALDAGDLEGAQEMLDQSNELLLMDTSKLPYKNVLENVNSYFKAQALANEQWQRLIDERTGAGEEFESEFEKSAREKEERDIKEEEKFKKIAEEKEEAEKAETEKFEKIKEEGLEEMEWKSEYYALIREGKHEEANALLKSKLKEGD